MTGTYVGSTFVEHQREFVEHFPYGNQLGKILDLRKTQKRRRAPKHILLGHKSENLEARFQILKMLENTINLLTKYLCRMAVTLFQTSSRGSELKQNRFGRKLRHTVNMQSQIKCGSDFVNQKQLNIVRFEN